MPLAITDYVSGDRLLQLVDRLALFGVREGGGVNRQALTEAEVEARHFLAGHARALGCQVFHDPAGNLFFRRDGIESIAPVLTGSHIDTQPAGGKLDGAYGVCAGLEVLAALRDARVRTRRPVEVVVWSNEEGCRFAPGSMGSAAFVDPARLAEFRATRDAQGVSYGECVDRMHSELSGIPSRGLGRDVHTFIEAHIEQGPVLEQARIPIGVVTGIQGVRWYRVRTLGQAAHAGTTPLEHRHDALRALVALAGEAYAFAERTPELRVTIGTLELTPGSINTIPGEAVLTIDVRHPEESALDNCEALLNRFCAEPRHGCQIGVERLMALPTTWFSSAVRTSIWQAAELLRLAAKEMISGAFHDSVHLANYCPTGMLFVPSRAGLSHNPDEHTDPEYLVAGARVLAAAIAQHAELIAAELMEKPA
jgi:N-carbamoyl-L-amino-acid hydrolase